MIDVLYALIESTDRAGTTDEWETQIATAEEFTAAWGKHCSAQHPERKEVFITPRSTRVTRTAPDEVTLSIEGQPHRFPIEVARALAVALGYVAAGER